MLREVNATNLVMIPKFNNACSVNDFRPIACCNTIYKCISKVLCNRLSSVLPSLVQENQGAFVKDRSILHNILITQELIRLYGRRRVSPRCMMKIDLRKAYDTLEWNFIEEMLHHLKFPQLFVDWTMECIKTASYNIVINGVRGNRFQGTRGIRQGDPISPLLFVLAMEMLTRT
ncbi:MAG: reverse transcriptase family protein, partial [Sweet potato little leaf phytoplasma]|nr:reverse transcriptase family protein [Sweet potato little leaf phytoplasma]